MNRTLEYIIPKEYEGKSLQFFLLSKGFSANNITMLKKMEKSVLINGNWSYMRDGLRENDILKVCISEVEDSPNIPAKNIPIDIAYEDEDILVVNKPKNMPVHPSLNNYENTLANAVVYYYQKQNKPFIFRCINRLDRDTTGLTIIAKHMISAGILYADMAKRKIKREYLAIVEKGENILQEKGTIDKPIGRDSNSLINRIIDYEKGKKAITHYILEKEFEDSYLIKLRLDTGRTHQIRVHMSDFGHPLVGDTLYGSYSEEIDRVALHSHKLNFFHPITKQNIELIVDMPKDMENYCLKRVI